MNNQKRKKRIWLWVLLLLLAAVAAAVIWQWRNIRTVHAVITTDKQTVVQELEAQGEKEQAILDHYEISVTAPSMEQREALLKGKVTAQEIKEALGLLPPDPEAAEDPAPGQDTPAEPASSEPGAPARENADDPQARANAVAEDCVRSLYALQADLFEQLSEYRKAALREWSDLPPEERTTQRKLAIATDVYGQCEALEKQADAEVRALLDSCREELSALGASTDIVDEMWKAYTDEKDAARLYYLSQYA